eukprot:scaffold1.g5658.t1
MARKCDPKKGFQTAGACHIDTARRREQPAGEERGASGPTPIMSQLRKLQTEIEKTLKKVAEGLGIFDDFWDQLQVTDNQNNREKLEAQLKTEIKKLQRFRDQIKTWAANNEIKDKTDLLNARKDIERRMEKFKAVEKEAKTKAFSKEGLGAASRLDPRERQRAEMRDWLNSTVESLNTQAGGRGRGRVLRVGWGLEEFDAELEGMAGQKTKKGGKAPPRVAHLDESCTRHRQHIMRLEQMLRLLDNDAIGPDEVDGIKDLLDDYLDRNQEDFDEFASPDDMYGDLLEQMDTMADSVVAAPPSHSKAARDKEAKLEKEREERERERQKAAAAAVKAQLAAQGNTRLAVEVDDPPAPTKPSASGGAPVAPLRTASSSASSAGAAAGAAAAAGGGGGAGGGGAPPPPPPPPAVHPPPPPPPGRTGKEPLSPAGGAPASSMAAVLAAQQQEAAAAAAGSAPGTPVRAGLAAPPAAGAALAPPEVGAAAAGATPPPPPVRQPPPQSPQVFTAPDGSGFQSAPPAAGPQANGLRPQGPTAAAVVAAGVAKRPVGPAPSGAVPAALRQSLDGGGEEGRSPDGSMDALAAQLRTMGLADGGPALTPAQSLQLLQATAARSIPQPTDALWQSVPQRARLPPVQPPSSYPTQRLPIFEALGLYEKLDAETLFFIFYNQASPTEGLSAEPGARPSPPGSYQQYLAARELKRQAWRFHKQLGAWFQRHEEPKAGGQPGDDWEQGTYVYFDALLHEAEGGVPAPPGAPPPPPSGWCYRLKQDFLFKYDSLEDETPNRVLMNGTGPGRPPAAPRGVAYLSDEDRRLLEAGKVEHRGTTEATRRALALAEQTRDVAQNTLVEAHRQGQQLSQVGQHVEVIDADVHEASALLRFMRRCCCFQCCDCCDPTVEQDRRRKQRVNARRADRDYAAQNLAIATEAKQQAVHRLVRQEDPAFGGCELAARKELLSASERLREVRRGPQATDIGHGLPEQDKLEIKRETEEQDANLEAIGDTVSALKVMGRELADELSGQAPQLARLPDRVAAAHDNLGGLTREARRI